jgi:hypothetical protein
MVATENILRAYRRGKDWLREHYPSEDARLTLKLSLPYAVATVCHLYSADHPLLSATRDFLVIVHTPLVWEHYVWRQRLNESKKLLYSRLMRYSMMFSSILVSTVALKDWQESYIASFFINGGTALYDLSKVPRLPAVKELKWLEKDRKTNWDSYYSAKLEEEGVIGVGCKSDGNIHIYFNGSDGSFENVRIVGGEVAESFRKTKRFMFKKPIGEKPLVIPIYFRQIATTIPDRLTAQTLRQLSQKQLEEIGVLQKGKQ